MTFANLEQRIADGYITMLPPFVPDASSGVSIPEQQAFYALMNGLYQLAFNEPQLFVATLHEDDAYPGFLKAPYGKPQLQTHMNKFTKAVDGLLQNMLLLGQGGEVQLNRRQQVILGRIGVSDFANLPAAWVWLANRPGGDLTDFSFCLFDKNYPYARDIYARLLGDKAFTKLESWMLQHGYKSYNIKNITASDCKLSLSYANSAWGEGPPNGGFEYKVRQTGISVRYDVCFASPLIIGLCIPGGLKMFLEAFDSADTAVKSFIARRTKKCDGCRYCVQTDKTGNRALAKIPVTHEGQRYDLCPYFPGYNYRWASLDEELAQRLIAMLAFMDGLAPQGK